MSHALGSHGSDSRILVRTLGRCSPALEAPPRRQRSRLGALGALGCEERTRDGQLDALLARHPTWGQAGLRAKGAVRTAQVPAHAPVPAAIGFREAQCCET